MSRLAKLGLPILLIIFILFGSYFYTTSPVDSSNESQIIFVVPPGQPASTISSRLKQQNLIKSDIAFQLYLNYLGLTKDLQAGDFRLSQNMSLKEIIETLAYNTLDYWITFPEGWRLEQYAEALSQKSLIDSQSFILAASGYEGRLFPDTYLIPYNASADQIIDLLTQNFDQKINSLNPQIENLQFTEDQIIIIASLIEREAKHQQDRPLVSSVIHNRLQINMALQIDATVQYILGKKGDWWPQNIKNKLKTPSPYNTYLNPGLPPAPIANPGLNSLKAAINPAQTNYLYYISDSGGYNHYAATLEEHQQNIDKYLK